MVTAGQLRDLAGITEGSTHNNGLVAVLLIVIVDGLHRLNTGVFLRGVVTLVGILEPVQDATYEWGNEEGTRLCRGNSLDEREHQGQVAVDLVLGL